MENGIIAIWDMGMRHVELSYRYMGYGNELSYRYMGYGNETCRIKLWTCGMWE